MSVSGDNDSYAHLYDALQNNATRDVPPTQRHHVRSDSDTIMNETTFDTLDDYYRDETEFTNRGDNDTGDAGLYTEAERLVDEGRYEDALQIFQGILKRTSKQIKYNPNPNRKSEQWMLYASTLYNIGVLFYKFFLYNDAGTFAILNDFR